MSNNNEEKFKMIDDIEVLDFDDDTIKNDSIDDNISIIDNPEKVSTYKEKKEEKISRTRSLDEIIESNKKLNSNNNDKPQKKRLNLQSKIIIMSIFIVALFCGAALLICEVLTNTSTDKVVKYTESSSNTYKVCLTEREAHINNSECLKENERYEEVAIDTIYANFKYNVDFSTDIDYKLAYHVSAITKIYNKYDENRILYKNEELLVDKKDISNESKNIDINESVSIDYQRYNEEVKNYKDKNIENTLSSVEIILYLDEEKETRKVSSITIPLNSSIFSIEKYNIHKKDKEVSLGKIEWDSYRIICAVIASLLVIIALLLVYRITQLVINNKSKKTIYQQKVLQILREYDRIIVIARDGYESNEEKEVLRVSSFDELLDVKDNLKKPIIYSKASEVKSEFIVEDDKRLYKYIMREND